MRIEKSEKAEMFRMGYLPADKSELRVSVVKATKVRRPGEFHT